MICPAKDNPFATRRIEAMGYIPQGVSWEWFDQRLEAMNYTAAIVGPHGSGKTTLLRQLCRRLSQQGKQTAHVFISEDITLPWRDIHRQIDPLPQGGVLLFDGASHLSRLQWLWLRYRVRRQRIGLIITSHRRGLLPSLIEHRPQAELLADLVGRLLGEPNQTDKEELESLFTRYQGNLRDCLRHLYDSHA